MPFCFYMSAGQCHHGLSGMQCALHPRQAPDDACIANPGVEQVRNDLVTWLSGLPMQALYEGARFDAVRRELTVQKSLVTLMALVLIEEHGRALHGLQILNACTQVRWAARSQTESNPVCLYVQRQAWSCPIVRGAQGQVLCIFCAMYA